MSKPLIANHQISRLLRIAPNDEQRVNYQGSFVGIESINTTEDVLVAVDSGSFCAIKAGTGFPCKSKVKTDAGHEVLVEAIYSYVVFRNESEQEMQVEIRLALGTPTDTRSVISGYMQVDFSAPEIYTPQALTVPFDDVAMIAADARVKERIVQNTGNTPIWWGDENVDPSAGRGTVIYPQGSASINCWGVVYFKAEDIEGRISINEIRKLV